MKVVLLGAAGQLGRALIADAPTSVTLRSCVRRDCDVTDETALEALILSEMPEVVINAAAYTRVDDAEDNQVVAEQINAIAPGIIASIARRAGARTVHISTDFVFDGRKSTPYAPDHPPSPLNVYGDSKWRGEQAVSSADPEALIVRTAWVYDAASANFVATIRRLASTQKRLTIVDDQIGTPTSARSLAVALWAMIEANARGIYHFTDSGVASWYDFAVSIVEEAHGIGLLRGPVVVEPVATRDFPTRAARPAFSVLDKSATWALLGRKAAHWRVNLRSVLQEAGHLG